MKNKEKYDFGFGAIVLALIIAIVFIVFCAMVMGYEISFQ